MGSTIDSTIDHPIDDAPVSSEADLELADPSNARWEKVVPFLAALVVTLPTLLASHIPMSDLPLHEGVVGVLRHFNDPAYYPTGLYQLNFGHPNQLFHLVAAALSFAVGVTWGVKLTVALAQVAIFVFGARLADHLGRSRWSVALLAPLALGYLYYWGLVANLVGIAVFLAVLPAIDRAAASPSPKSAAITVGCLLLLFLGHGSVFMVTTGLIYGLAILYPIGRGTIWRAAPPIVATGAWIVWFKWSNSIFPPALQVTSKALFISKTVVLARIPRVLFGKLDPMACYMLTLLGFIALIGFAARRYQLDQRTPLPDRPRLGKDLAQVRAYVLHHRFEIAAGLFALGYLTFPMNYNGATMINERFLGLAWALAVLVVAPRKGFSIGRVPKLAAFCLPLGVIAMSWPEFLDAHISSRNLDVLLARIPRGSGVAFVTFEHMQHDRAYSAAVAPARSLATIGGRTSLNLLTSPISPILVRPDLRFDEFDRRTFVLGSRGIVPSHDLRRFEWVIAQSRERDTQRFMVAAFKPDAEFVAVQGEWVLLKSTHKILPLDAPEQVPNWKGPPRTILERMNEQVDHGAEVQREMAKLIPDDAP